MEVNVRVLQTKKHKKYGVLSIKTKLIGTEGTRLLRESVAKGDTTGAKRRGGSRTARGKRVPGVEIHTHPLLQKSAPFPPAACQVLITEGKRPVVRSFINRNGISPKKLDGFRSPVCE
ncbi:hypothetical protein P4555_01205 [Peribacillus frigoritolerans]|uniref:hypothetical protein n=1 Tax=Peribacillus frigoritolerans TaxID=450367 RepID=UPI002E22F9F9|nr:hypothetical protein [Peribacillus frigoritolerans]